MQCYGSGMFIPGPNPGMFIPIRIPDPDLDFLPIPDSGVKKGTRSGSATLAVCALGRKEDSSEGYHGSQRKSTYLPYLHGTF